MLLSTVDGIELTHDIPLEGCQQQLSRSHQPIENPSLTTANLPTTVSDLDTSFTDSPPLHDYPEARARNQSRQLLGLSPDPESLFIQYLEETLQHLQRYDINFTHKVMDMIADQIIEQVETDVIQWMECSHANEDLSEQIYRQVVTQLQDADTLVALEHVQQALKQRDEQTLQQLLEQAGIPLTHAPMAL
ncbi:MAG: hypothetical protein OIF57_18095 [Marinobacterium sp.]|nr:hypothetical protein [Marinobacterium sp.]